MNTPGSQFTISSLPACLAILVGLSLPASAVTRTWDGGPGGTGTAFLTGANWSSDTVPVSGDVALWNGTVAGNLGITFNAAVGGSNGLSLSLGATQTGNVTITNNAGSIQTLRLSDISLASGSGGLTLGGSGDSFNVALGSGANYLSHAWTNNSTGTATIGSNAVFVNGGAINHPLSIGGSGNWVIAAPIANASNNGLATSITKTGSGSLTLSGDNVTPANSFFAWTGQATVSAGTLLVTGNSGSATFLSTGGILAGAGGTLGATTIQTGGSLAAGIGAVSALSTGTLSFQGSGEWKFDLNTTLATADSLAVSGNLSISNSAVLTFNDVGTNQVLGLGTTFSILDYSGTWNGGTFSGYADDSVFTSGANQFQISYNGADGSSSVVLLTVVPEPASSVLLFGAGCGLLMYRHCATKRHRG